MTVITGLLTLAWAATASAVSPQWTVAVENLVRTQEKPSADLSASWTSLADGSQLLAVLERGAGRGIVLRRIDAHGRIGEFAELDGPVNAAQPLALLAAAQDGAYVLTSATPEASTSRLYRFDADGRPRWAFNLPTKPAAGDGRAVKLLAQADGSALVLRKRSLTHVSAAGGVDWQFGDGDGGQQLLDLADAIVDRQGVTWVGGRGGLRSAGQQEQASLRRFDREGNLLSLRTMHCERCGNSRVLSLAPLSDGKVVAVGRSGVNQPGFFAVYYSDGSQRLLALTAPGGGFDRVVADAADNVYALSEDTRTVTAIHLADGRVRWRKSGSDIAPLPGGVLITQSPASGTGALSLDAFDADGNTRWTRQIAAVDGSALGGAREAGGITRLVAMVERESEYCGLSPALVTLDATGSLLADVRACSVNTARNWSSVDAAPAAGAIGNLAQRMIRFSTYAEKSWEFSTCLLCPGPTTAQRTDASRLMPDGSSWLTTSRPASADFPQGEFILHHLAADGTRLSQTALPPPEQTGELHDVRILADATQAVVLVSHQGGLRWARVSAAGELLDSVRTTLPGNHPVIAFANARLWPDGSVSVATRRDHGASCEYSPPAPICDGTHHALLRMGADGSQRWLAELGSDRTYIGIEDDGSSVVLSRGWDHDAPVQLRRVAADGMTGAPLDLPNAINGYVGDAIGPVRGRYLVNLMDGLALIDRHGTVVAQSQLGEYGWSQAFGDTGFIVINVDREARLISADDLRVLARFEPPLLNTASAHENYWGNWSLQDDGSVYATEPPWRGNGYRPRLARFAVPGSPADDVIFIDRF